MRMRFASTVIYVDGVAPVLDFYRAAFGCETRFYDPDVQLAGQPAGVEIAFFCDDVQAAFDRAVAAGAAVVRAPTLMPWVQWVAYVRSLEGTYVGLCSPLTAAASG